MRVQVCYHEGGGTYTFDAPEGTNVGDVMSENEDGTGKRIEVVRIGSDYEGKVRQLWPHADPPEDDERDAAQIADGEDIL